MDYLVSKNLLLENSVMSRYFFLLFLSSVFPIIGQAEVLNIASYLFAGFC